MKKFKKANWKYGIIDHNGKTIVEPKYSAPSRKNGLICAIYQDKNYNDIVVGYITEKGGECWDE